MAVPRAPSNGVDRHPRVLASLRSGLSSHAVFLSESLPWPSGTSGRPTVRELTCDPFEQYWGLGPLQLGLLGVRGPPAAGALLGRGPHQGCMAHQPEPGRLCKVDVLLCPRPPPSLMPPPPPRGHPAILRHVVASTAHQALKSLGSPPSRDAPGTAGGEAGALSFQVGRRAPSWTQSLHRFCFR